MNYKGIVWLNTHKLKSLVKQANKVYHALLTIRKNKEQYPDWVYSPNGSCMYLNADKFNEFCETFHFDQKDCDNNNDGWLNAEDVTTQVVGQTPENINKLFKTLKASLPLLTIISKKDENGNSALYLHKDYLKRFCSAANIKRSLPLKKRPTGWLTFKHLQKYILDGDKHADTIYKLLLQYRDTNPSMVNYRTKNNKGILCILMDFIPQFCHDNNFEYIYKTTEWLSAPQIAKQLHIPQKTVRNILYKLYVEKSNMVKVKRLTDTDILCLNKKDLENLQDILNKNAESILFDSNKSQRQWLTATEITLFIKDGVALKDKIKELFIKLYNKRNRPAWLRRTSRTMYLINKDYLKDFCDLCKFELIYTPTTKQITADTQQIATNKSNSRIDNWVTASTLRNLIISGVQQRQTLHDSVVELYESGEHPNWVRKTKSGFYMFNTKYLRRFCKLYSFEIRDEQDPARKRKSPKPFTHTVKKYDGDWLKQTDVQKLILNGADKRQQIHEAMLDLYNQKSDSDWIRRISPSRYILNKKYLQQFCDMYTFELRDIPDASTKWVTIVELKHILYDKSNNITTALKDLRTKGTHPGWVYQLSANRYFFNAEHIEDFADMYNLRFVCREKRRVS